MKRAGGLLLLLGVLIIAPVPRVQAAACANTSSYGAIVLHVPELTKLESQILWLRVQSPESTGRLLAEVNESDCIDISFSGPANQWSWQAQRANDAVVPITFERSTGNVVKLIGVSSGVKVDRMLLTESSCVPRDFGNNCQSSVELKSFDSQPVSSIEPLTHDAVSGEVELSHTPAKNRTKLKKLEYIVEARVVQSSETVEPFDTTLITNGKHSIQIHTTLQDGTVLREMTVVDVKNPQSFYTPLMRWIRLNERIVNIAVMIIGGVAIIMALYYLMRRQHQHKRQRKFRGF